MNNTIESKSNVRSFLAAFAAAAQLRADEAEDQWGAFSRQLSDSEIEEIEQGGTASGMQMGEEYLRLYPVSQREEIAL